MQPALCTLREPLTLTIQFKITLNLKYSMNNKKIEQKEEKKLFQKKQIWLVIFMHFDEIKRFVERISLCFNVVKQKNGRIINTKMC